MIVDFLSSKLCPERVFLWWLPETYGGGAMVEERERVKRQTFLGLEIGLECNKWGQLMRS